MAQNLCTRPEFIKSLNTNLDMILAHVEKDSLQKGGLIDEKLQSQIPLPQANKRFTAYKLDGCPYSDKAGDVLQQVKGAQSFYLNRDLQADRSAVQNFLTRHTDYDKDTHRTFPIVFAGDKFLGGYQELSEYLSKIQHAGNRSRRTKSVHKKVRSRTKGDYISRRRSLRKAGKQGI